MTAALIEKFSSDECDGVVVAFWQELGVLFEKHMKLFTLGESTSLPEYDAYRLLASLCFVLGLDRENLEREAVISFVQEGVEQVFLRNLTQIESEVRRVDMLWESATRTAPLQESVALQDTLKSLQHFSARYDHRFFAHEIPADIDYPLCFPVEETLQGVRYVNTYLERLILEDHVVCQFDAELRHLLLEAISPVYKDLILNVFEPLAVNAIGCALAGCDVKALQIHDEDRCRIEQRCACCSEGELRLLMEEASSCVCDTLEVFSPEVYRLMSEVAKALVPRVKRACAFKGLAGVFLTW